MFARRLINSHPLEMFKKPSFSILKKNLTTVPPICKLVFCDSPSFCNESRQCKCNDYSFNLIASLNSVKLANLSLSQQEDISVYLKKINSTIDGIEVTQHGISNYSIENN